jgi:hypothetical protein
MTPEARKALAKQMGQSVKDHTARAVNESVAPLRARILRLETDVATLEALLGEMERRLRSSAR